MCDFHKAAEGLHVGAKPQADQDGGLQTLNEGIRISPCIAVKQLRDLKKTSLPDKPISTYS